MPRKRPNRQGGTRIPEIIAGARWDDSYVRMLAFSFLERKGLLGDFETYLTAAAKAEAERRDELFRDLFDGRGKGRG